MSVFGLKRLVKHEGGVGDYYQRKTYFKRYRERAQGMILAEVMKYGYTVLIPFGEGRRSRRKFYVAHRGQAERQIREDSGQY